jgi:cation:H+ antiporter
VTEVLGLLAGLALLVVGAELVVREGSALADRLGIPPIVVGMTVVSLGTSLPELAIGLNAARQDNGGLAVGNIVGTNLVNVLLVLGLAAAIRPVTFEQRTLQFDLPVMIGAAFLLLLTARDGALSTLDGAWLCLYGAAYLSAVLVTSMRTGRTATATATVEGAAVGVGRVPGSRAADLRDHPMWRTAVLLVGLGLIVGGSELLVDAAIDIARDLGVSDAVVGLTIVAIGTSTPELVTTLVSTFRGERALAVGNLLGSSVFNIALILGPTVLAAPGAIVVPDDVLAVDLILMVASAVVCAPLFWSRRRLSRIEGCMFVAAYLGYLVWQIVSEI